MSDGCEVPREPVTPQVRAILDDLVGFQKDISDEDVPGWTISKPTIIEVNSEFRIVQARSKPEEHAPFFLPDDAEVAVAVQEGSIRVDAGRVSTTLVGRHFMVVTAGPGRSVTALEPIARIYCFYFRAVGVGSDGSAPVPAR